VVCEPLSGGDGSGGRRQEDDGVRDRRERVHCLCTHQDVAGEGIRRQDDGQEPRFGSPLCSQFSVSWLDSVPAGQTATSFYHQDPNDFTSDTMFEQPDLRHNQQALLDCESSHTC